MYRRLAFALAFGVASTRADEWSQTMEREGTVAQPVIQNRAVTKEGRVQLLAAALGHAERRDFYNTWFASGAIRYHFSEKNGWEVLRYFRSWSSETAAAKDVRARTGFLPDVQVSRHQLSSAYVWTPIYGKYAWNEFSLVHFDIHATLGAGLRWARDRQPFAELGLGMNHFVYSNRLSLVADVRVRLYSEKRSASVFVAETLAELGLAWLF